MCFIRLDIIILFCSWCGVFLYHHIITAVNSFHPGLEYTWEISETSLAFNWRQQFMHTTNLQIHIVTCCIYPRIRHTSRIPYLFQFLRLRRLCSNDSDFFETLERRQTWLSYFCRLCGPSPCPTNWSTVSITTAEKESSDRIPFTLTFHPHRPRS